MNVTRIFHIVALLSVALHHASADDWPQWLGPQRDAVWRETDIVEKFPEGGPKRVWRTELGAGYSGPAVAGGRVFVMDRLVPTNAPKAKSVFEALIEEPVGAPFSMGLM